MLFFHEVSLYEFRALHLESKHVWETFDPGCLRCPISLTIFVVLVVCNITPEHVLPCLVKVSLVLNVQHYVIHHIILRLSLRHRLFVDELNQVFYVTLEHFLKLSLFCLIFLY